MSYLIQALTELTNRGSVILESGKVKEFSKMANAHALPFEIGPHVSGKSVLITI